MIHRRLILLGAIVGALTVSAIAVFCALIVSLHHVFASWLGDAGGWALLFGLLALALAAAALVARAMARGKRRKAAAKRSEVPVIDLLDQFAALVRERPVAAISTAVGAGVMAVRDPDKLASALRQFAARADDR